jgi:hypothetical protein
MSSSPSLAHIRVPELSPERRSSVVAVTGTAAIGGICLLTTVRALAERAAYASSGAAAVGILGAVAVFVSVVRWVPSLEEESVRTVPRAHAAALLTASIAVGVVALAVPTRRGALIGLLSSLCVLNVYLSCWGYRSLFLLRRLVLFSVLSWPVVARAVHRYVDASLTGPSDLVFRRLGAFGIASADDHPWRVLSAMTEHATVAVTAVVVLTIASSRLRLSVAALGRLLVGSVVAMIVHHVVLLSVPLERYDRTWMANLVTGPAAELAIAALIAVWLYSWTSAMAADEHVSNPSPDRDPEIFGAHDIPAPATAMRFCSLVVPAAVMALVVIRP